MAQWYPQDKLTAPPTPATAAPAQGSMCLSYRVPGLTSLPSSQQHPPKHPAEDCGRGLFFFGWVLLAGNLPPHNMALRWPSDIFLSCQGAWPSNLPYYSDVVIKSWMGEHGFLKMFKNLFQAVKMLPKTAPQYKLDLVPCNGLWPIYSVSLCISSLPGLKDFEAGKLFSKCKNCIGKDLFFFFFA